MSQLLVSRLMDWLRFVVGRKWQRGCLDQSCYDVALRAADLEIPGELVFRVCSQWITEAGGILDPAKLNSQIARARQYVIGHEALEPATRWVVRKLRPEFSPGALAMIARSLDIPDIEKFIEDRSPIRPDSVGCDDFLARVYGPGERVLIFTNHMTQGQLLWERDRLLGQAVPTSGADGVWYLVNPVDGQYHANPRQGGKQSRRSAESVTTFRYAVLESDSAGADNWLKFLALAPLRIAALYASGGRSIHALVRVDAKSKADWDAEIKPYKPILTIMGADPGCLSAVRLSRLPQAWRGDRQQRLIYLAPEADGTPIHEMPPRSDLDDATQFAEGLLTKSEPVALQAIQQCRQVLSELRDVPRAVELLAQLGRRYPGGIR